MIQVKDDVILRLRHKLHSYCEEKVAYNVIEKTIINTWESIFSRTHSISISDIVWAELWKGDIHKIQYVKGKTFVEDSNKKIPDEVWENAKILLNWDGYLELIPQ